MRRTSPPVRHPCFIRRMMLVAAKGMSALQTALEHAAILLVPRTRWAIGQSTTEPSPRWRSRTIPGNRSAHRRGRGPSTAPSRHRLRIAIGPPCTTPFASWRPPPRLLTSGPAQLGRAFTLIGLDISLGSTTLRAPLYWYTASCYNIRLFVKRSRKKRLNHPDVSVGVHASVHVLSGFLLFLPLQSTLPQSWHGFTQKTYPPLPLHSFEPHLTQWRTRRGDCSEPSESAITENVRFRMGPGGGG